METSDQTMERARQLMKRALELDEPEARDIGRNTLVDWLVERRVT